MCALTLDQSLPALAICSISTFFFPSTTLESLPLADQPSTCLLYVLPVYCLYSCLRLCVPVLEYVFLSMCIQRLPEEERQSRGEIRLKRVVSVSLVHLIFIYFFALMYSNFCITYFFYLLLCTHVLKLLHNLLLCTHAPKLIRNIIHLCIEHKQNCIAVRYSVKT